MPIDSSPKTIYDITVTELNKTQFKLEKYRGEVLLIVNIATTCGLSEKSLSELSTLMVKFRSKGMKILLFPCNGLLTKKCKSISEFKDYTLRFSDDFILMDEVQVTGNKIHPLFEYLRSKDEEFMNGDVKLNFTYFLINRKGELVKKYLPTGHLTDSDPDLLKCIGEAQMKTLKIPFHKITRLKKNFDSDSTD